MKDKLEQQRQELELQLGLSAHATPSALTVASEPDRLVRSVRSGAYGGKGTGKVGSTIQTRKTAGVKRKRSTPPALSEPTTSSSDGDLVREEVTTMSQENYSPVSAGGGSEEIARTVDKVLARDSGDGISVLEKEVDQALEELFNE